MFFRLLLKIISYMNFSLIQYFAIQKICLVWELLGYFWCFSSRYPLSQFPSYYCWSVHTALKQKHWRC